MSTVPGNELLTEVEVPSRAGARAGALGKVADAVIRSLVPVLLALIAGGILLLILGHNPFSFYSSVWEHGAKNKAWQESAKRMAPLLLIAVGLIVAFRANIWNLGYNGQFLLAAAVISGLAPSLVNDMPLGLAFLILFIVAGLVGGIWTIVPALLKAYYDTNEIITTLMMSFIGVGLAQILIKGPFQDPSVNIAQTKVLELDQMLPHIPGTKVHIGVIVALVAAVVVYIAISRTAFGLKIDVLGANPRAARHVGIQVRQLVLTSFFISGALIGFAAAADILGVWGYIRANWNPAYGDTVIPFVFLARLNPLVVIPFIAFFAVLSTGGTLATQEVGLPTDFLLVLVALILLFMTVIEFFGRRRSLGQSYLPQGLREALHLPGPKVTEGGEVEVDQKKEVAR
ncbi:MAG: ABC transporter permease [Solirubrobacterales bacterium]